jgi:hypothetical protein
MQSRFLPTSRLVTAAAAVTLATGIAIVGAPGAFAADGCGAYASQCPTPTPTVITTTPINNIPPTSTAPPTTTAPATTTTAPTTTVAPTTTSGVTVAPTTTTPVPSVKGTTLTKTPEGSTLPFTGGEFVLMASAGAIALGAGAALVIGSRRRRSA